MVHRRRCDNISSGTLDTAASMGWERLQNGELLDQAQRHGYEVLVTTDQSMRYQQNPRRGLAIVVLMRAWPPTMDR